MVLTDVDCVRNPDYLIHWEKHLVEHCELCGAPPILYELRKDVSSCCFIITSLCLEHLVFTELKSWRC